MKKQFKLGPNQKKWISALRSGKYRKCTKWLFSDRGVTSHRRNYCALGVALRIFNESILHVDESGTFFCKLSLGPEHETLIAHLNDGIGCKPHSFAEIAEVIENDPSRFFRKSA